MREHAELHRKIDRVEQLIHQRINHLFLRDTATKVCVLEHPQQKAILATLAARGYRVTTQPQGAGAIVGLMEVVAGLKYTTQPVIFVAEPLDLAAIVDNLLVAFGPPVENRRKPK